MPGRRNKKLSRFKRCGGQLSHPAAPGLCGGAAGGYPDAAPGGKRLPGCPPGMDAGHALLHPVFGRDAGTVRGSFALSARRVCPGRQTHRPAPFRPAADGGGHHRGGGYPALHRPRRSARGGGQAALSQRGRHRKPAHRSGRYPGRNRNQGCGRRTRDHRADPVFTGLRRHHRSIPRSHSGAGKGHPFRLHPYRPARPHRGCNLPCGGCRYRRGRHRKM